MGSQDRGAMMTQDASELIAAAEIAKRDGDPETAISLLQQAFEVQPTPMLAARIGNEAVLAQDFSLARWAFTQQASTGVGSHQWNSAFGLARVEIILGEREAFDRSIAGLSGRWQTGVPAINRLLITAMRHRRVDWLGDLLARYCLALRTEVLPDLIGATLTRIRDEAAAAALLDALRTASGSKMSPAAISICCYLSMVGGERAAVLGWFQKLALADADQHALAEPAKSALAVLPQTLEAHLDPFSTTLTERLADIDAAVRAPVALMVNSKNHPEEISSLLKGARSAAILPVTSDLLSNRQREEEWLNALASFGPRSGVRIVDYVTEYGDVNSAPANVLSDAADAVAKCVMEGLPGELPSRVNAFLSRHPIVAEMQVSDAVFRHLRRRASLMGFLAAEKPAAIIIYASTAASLRESLVMAEASNSGAKILIGSACAPYHLWPSVLDAGKPASEDVPEIKEDAPGIQADEDAWSLIDAELADWGPVAARKLANASKPPILISSAVDRVYGPTVRILKSEIESQYSVFSLFMPSIGRGGESHDKLLPWSVESERLLELPALPPRLVSGVVQSETVDAWLVRINTQIQPALDAAAMVRHELSSATSDLLTSLLTRSLPQQMHQAKALEKLFTLARPAAILAQPTRIATHLVTVREARAASILSIEAMAVYMSRMPRYRAPAADAVLAIDTYSRDLLTGHFGLRQDQVDIVGSLRFEPSIVRLSEAPKAIVEDGRPMIMVVTQTGSLARNRALVWNALNILRKVDGDYRLVVKVHPGEPELHVKAYQGEIARFQMSDRASVTKDQDPYELARSAKLVVSSFSNLALEAAAFGVSVLVLALDEGTLPVPFDTMGVAVVARRGPEFISFASDLLQDGPISAKLKETRDAFFERNPLLNSPGAARAAGRAVVRRVSAGPGAWFAPDQVSLKVADRDVSWVVSRERNQWRFLRAGDQAPSSAARRLVLIEWTTRPQTLIEFLASLTPSDSAVTYVCGNPALKSELQRSEAYRDGHDEIAAYAAVDTSLDDHFYAAAGDFVAPLREVLVSELGSSYLPDAVSDRLQDQLIIPYRFSSDALRLSRAGGYEEAILVGNPNGSAMSLVAPLLYEGGVNSVVYYTGSATVRERDALNNAIEAEERDDLLDLSPFAPASDGPNPLDFLRDRRAILVTTAADPTYRDSAVEIVGGSRKPAEWGVALLAGDQVARDELDQGIRHSVQGAGHTPSGMILGTRRAAIAQGTANALQRSFAALQRASAKNDDAVAKVFRRYLCSLASLHISRNASYALSVGANFEEVLSDCSARVVAATPGRSTEARIAFHVARSNEISTLDIQTGTFSASKRYRKPIADMVTAIDRAHHNIYSEYFGVDPEIIETVGSPRIDRRLRPVRAADRQGARAEYFRKLGISGDPVVTLLATQPIEWGRAEEIVRLTLAGAPLGSLTVIKPHPAETPERVEAYVAAANAAGRWKHVYVEREQSAYELLPIADVVATYFSTLALEGFAVRREVAIIDPFSIPPTLDFAAMGVGSRVRKPRDLTAIIKRAKNRDVALSVDPMLAALQDGRSAERIDDIIDELSRGRVPGFAQ